MSNEIIFSYTRSEAIDDGVLIDAPVNALAKEYGIKFHCAMTANLFSRIDPTDDEKKKLGQDLTGRIWDMLTLFKAEIKKAGDASTIDFTLILAGSGEPGRPVWDQQAVKAVCGPGDNAEPVITFMLLDED